MKSTFPPVSASFETKYELVSEIGRGGMGVVYLANDRRSNQKLAIKFFKTMLFGDVAAQDHFVQEARLLAREAGKTSNLVKVYGFGTEGDYLYIAFEFVDGITLRQAMDTQKTGNLRQVLSIAHKLCRGLSILHQKQVVHMDLKPENVMLASDGTVKLIDLGIALSLSQRKEASSSGQILGTPVYMSPEQCSESKITYSSDLYSLGVILYEMISGVPPFFGDTPAVIKGHLFQDVLPMVPGGRVPEVLCRLVYALLSKDTSKRPGSAVVVARRLSEILRDSSVEHLLTCEVPVPSKGSRAAIGKSIQETVKITSEDRQKKDKEAEKGEDLHREASGESSCQSERTVFSSADDKKTAVGGTFVLLVLLGIVLAISAVLFLW